jgi:membrane-bound lytic murein transglycosylase
MCSPVPSTSAAKAPQAQLTTALREVYQDRDQRVATSSRQFRARQIKCRPEHRKDTTLADKAAYELKYELDLADDNQASVYLRQCSKYYQLCYCG